jgi:hypothetical protein
LAGGIISGCNHSGVKINDSSKIEHDLIQKLKKDSLIIAFNKIQGELDLDIAAHKFNLLHYNKEMVDNNRKNCRTPAQLIALFKKAGMTHADEYYALTWSKIRITWLLERKYPDLYQLPRSERKDIFEAVVNPKVSTAAMIDSLERQHAMH